MFKKLVIFVLFVAFSSTGFAQSETKTVESKKGRPDIPGTFAIDLGLNFPSEKAGFNTNPFGSRTLNIYYYYDLQIGKSSFSIHPGFGFGLERYKFNNDKTLGYVSPTSSEITMVPVSEVVEGSSLKKTSLITNYIDVPLEVRFSANPDDPGRTFKMSLGFKFGVLYESFTKIKYRDNGETKRLKDKQNYNLNPIRYGALFRIGFGNISLYANYTLSPLFENGKGPDRAVINNFTAGFTMAVF